MTFPLSETPVFVDAGLAQRLCRAVRSFFRTIATDEYRLGARDWVPSGLEAGGDLSSLPGVSCFDFAVARSPEGRPEPYLLECQGFSSLMAVVPRYGQLLCEELAPELAAGLTPFLSHGTAEEYWRELSDALGHSLLIDIETGSQKLRTDFWVMRRRAGVEVADLSLATIRRLDRSHERVLCRVVPPEAERRGCAELLQKLFGKERRWVSHPDWFFRLSKRSLPLLGRSSRLVTPTVELTARSLEEWQGRGGFVLKPCYDYGGRGVRLEPTADELRAALASGRPHVLQERLDLVRCVQPPDGPPLFLDIRVMCLRDRPASLFCRLSQAHLSNIDYNDRYRWCGITAGLVPRELRRSDLEEETLGSSASRVDDAPQSALRSHP